jgi:tripartite ATP-independent transporter DctM subunit
MVESLIGFAILMLLVFMRLPIAFAMAIVGVAGFAYLVNWTAALALISQTIFGTALTYELSVLPLFILMGNFVNRAGLSRELYDASHAFLGHRRGGLAMATIVACGGFSAICGSSLATAATMSQVAMPAMRNYGYADSLAAGSIAAGGTLGILIPPSVILVIYGILTETSIGKLFAAGVLPGLLGVVCYMGAVQYVIRRRPELGPPAERTDWPGRLKALGNVWGVILLFVVVMGGIYTGAFTPTEAAGIGAFCGFLFAWYRRALTWRVLGSVLAESARTTAMLFTILFGALLFANFVNTAGFPTALITFAKSFDVAPIVIVIIILVIYILLGCVFESLSMLLLTVPVFFPLVADLGYDLIWFGIIVVVVTEISLITPPVGLNVFVLRGVLPDVSTSTVFRGVTPFWCADIVRLAILVALPSVSLVLPSLFFK